MNGHGAVNSISNKNFEKSGIRTTTALINIIKHLGAFLKDTMS